MSFEELKFDFLQVLITLDKSNFSAIVFAPEKGERM
jgi:hypothetical protein